MKNEITFGTKWYGFGYSFTTFQGIFITIDKRLTVHLCTYYFENVFIAS